MRQKNTSTNGGKDEETYKCSALLEEEKIDGEISAKGAESLTNQELLAVILSGDMEALTAAVNLLNIYHGNLVHLFCASDKNPGTAHDVSTAGGVQSYASGCQTEVNPG